MTSAADLKYRVRFECRFLTDDDAGGSSYSDWTEQFSRLADIKLLKASEPVIGQRLQGIQPVLIIVRFDQMTQMITSDFRAVEVLNGRDVRFYAIRSAEDIERQQRFITILAESGANDGGRADS